MSRAHSMHISINMIPKYNAFEYLKAYPPWYLFYGLIIKTSMVLPPSATELRGYIHTVFILFFFYA
jgi:hypothetical protein